MTNTRGDLPENTMADEHRKIVREVTLEYLRDHTTREERKTIIKEAFKELVKEHAAKFGWFSAKTLGIMFLTALFYIWLTTNGWHK